MVRACSLWLRGLAAATMDMLALLLREGTALEGQSWLGLPTGCRGMVVALEGCLLGWIFKGMPGQGKWCSRGRWRVSELASASIQLFRISQVMPHWFVKSQSKPQWFLKPDIMGTHLPTWIPRPRNAWWRAWSSSFYVLVISLPFVSNYPRVWFLTMSHPSYSFSCSLLCITSYECLCCQFLGHVQSEFQYM